MTFKLLHRAQRIFVAVVLFLPPAGFSAGSSGGEAFQFNDGDRVVFLGDTLMEREQAYGYLEERLTVEFPGRRVIFRNLGWSADTPAGISRASFDFDKPGKAFEVLKAQVEAVHPTVVILGYGMACSFDGPEKLPEFRDQFNALVDAVQKMNTNGLVRLVFLAPINHENTNDLSRQSGETTVDAQEIASHNRNLKAYSEVIKQIAEERHAPFVSLLELSGKGTPLTDNGIHLSGAGYACAAQAIAAGLGWERDEWHVSIARDGKATGRGTHVTDLRQERKGVRFDTMDDRLVTPLPLETTSRAAFLLGQSCQVQVAGLKRGRYELRVDGSPLLAASEKQWAAGVNIHLGPQFEQAEALRRAILQKNNLYFDRWRPQNETYLLGFRKHEQGQNAKEIPMFDPLVAEQETAIAELRRPKKHTFELAPVTDSSLPLRSVITMDRADSPPFETTLRESTSAGPLADKPSFDVAPGFEVNLFAESPLLAKPIQMNFDPKGRLWIASSSVYPQILPGQIPDDKIIVLEDSDGDGYAEKSTVFASGLMIPTAVIPGDGGAYVAQGTQLLHFKDTNGDGHADQKQIVLSAFGTEDTHHLLHTLRWGPDGQLYFNQSIYIHTHIETPHGVRRLNSGGVWHLRTKTLDLGILLKGFCNPWGHAIDEFGQSFETDGAGNQGISYGLPGATYFTYASMRRELPSISPGSYPKFCGLELIRSPHFPADWQGSAITCDFRAHRVVRFNIEEQGSAYAAHEVGDLLRTTNVTFRPIDVKLGPDGALYIADWSNPIIQHGEVDFRDPRRDHEHGRIWRITAKERSLLTRPSLFQASNKQLLDELIGANSVQRAKQDSTENSPVTNGLPAGLTAYNQQQARRVLAERGPAIQNDLASWTRAQHSDFALLQALWMYQTIDVIEPMLLEKVLHAKDGRIRAAAVRVLSAWEPRLKNPSDWLAERVADEHPRVRLEAVRALANIPSARSAALVLSALEKPMDSFLDYSVWLSINDLALPWLAAVKSGEWKPDGREKELEFALKAIDPTLAPEVLGQVLQTREIPRDGKGPWIDLIETSGDPKLLRRLFEQVRAEGFDEAGSVRALAALNKAARQRGAKPEGKLEDLGGMISTGGNGDVAKSKTVLDAHVQEEVLRLAGNWKLPVFVPQLEAVAQNASTTSRLRAASLDALRDIGGSAAVTALEKLSASESPAIRREVVTRLAVLDIEKASPPAVAVLTNTVSETEAAELWRSLLTVKNAGSTLARALPKTGLPPAMAKAGLQVAREGTRNEPDLVWALTRGANLEAESQTLSAAELKELAASAMKQGDPARGEKIFRRLDLACINCHAVGGVGGKVGPDLTSIGASAQPDYLVESVLYPNRKIKEGYHAVSVETKDNLEYTGVLVSENQDQLILRDASGKETTVAKKNIENRTTGGSLMPSGLVDSLVPAERLDLFRFLAELGKPGPYDASKATVARSWHLLVQTLDLAQFADDKVLKIDLSDKQWTPANSLVDGDLPKGELDGAMEKLKSRDPSAIFAATKFEVPKNGPVNLKLVGPKTYSAWVDGKSVLASGLSAADLTPGTHVFVAKLDARNFPKALRLESSDVTFLSN